MPSVLLIAFILQLTIHLVNTIGAATINTLLWSLYTKLPTPTAKLAAEQTKLKADLIRLRTELNGTSSQDQFAKWAKLRRQHDKVQEQFDKSKSSLSSTKSVFDSSITTIRWLGTNGVRMLLQLWFSKQPMFWLPKGWAPYYAEWLLSFPRAPLGSISIQAWQLACASIILLSSDAIAASIGLVLSAQSQQPKQTKETPMKVSAEKSRVSPSVSKKFQ